MAGLQPRSKLFCQLVQSEVQVEDIDAGLAKEAELAIGDVFLDELIDAGLRDAASLGDARNLKEGCVWSDVWVEAGAGSGDQIDGNRLAGILLRELVDGALDAVDQRLV